MLAKKIKPPALKFLIVDDEPDVVEITDDADAARARWCEQVPSLDPGHLRELPYALIGIVDEIAAHVYRCRERWGITYFAVRALDEFAPVIEAVRSGDRTS